MQRWFQDDHAWGVCQIGCASLLSDPATARRLASLFWLAELHAAIPRGPGHISGRRLSHPPPLFRLFRLVLSSSSSSFSSSSLAGAQRGGAPFPQWGRHGNPLMLPSGRRWVRALPQLLLEHRRPTYQPLTVGLLYRLLCCRYNLNRDSVSLFILFFPPAWMDATLRRKLEGALGA
jgi:hypothetical protein